MLAFHDPIVLKSAAFGLSGGEQMTGAVYHWFFPKKARIAFMALMIYAALC